MQDEFVCPLQIIHVVQIPLELSRPHLKGIPFGEGVSRLMLDKGFLGMQKREKIILSLLAVPLQASLQFQQNPGVRCLRIGAR